MVEDLGSLKQTKHVFLAKTIQFHFFTFVLQLIERAINFSHKKNPHAL